MFLDDLQLIYSISRPYLCTRHPDLVDTELIILLVRRGYIG